MIVQFFEAHLLNIHTMMYKPVEPLVVLQSNGTSFAVRDPCLPGPDVRSRSVSDTVCPTFLTPRPKVRPRSSTAYSDPYLIQHQQFKQTINILPSQSSQKPNYVTQCHPDQTINGREPATDLCQHQESSCGNSQAAEDEPGCYPWLYDNSARYMACLDEFQRFSDEWQGVQGWIGDNLATLVDLQNLGYENDEMLARKIECGQSSDWHPEVYKMLGVGSGSGEFTSHRACIFTVKFKRKCANASQATKSF